MKPLKLNIYGWHLGCRFEVIGRKKWNNTYVYKLRFSSKNSRWIEYMEHNKILTEKCFYFNYDGSFKVGMG
jgi:hypothetical protein